MAVEGQTADLASGPTKTLWSGLGQKRRPGKPKPSVDYRFGNPALTRMFGSGQMRRRRPFNGHMTEPLGSNLLRYSSATPSVCAADAFDDLELDPALSIVLQFIAKYARAPHVR
jgi:hypothetical protein